MNQQQVLAGVLLIVGSLGGDTSENLWALHGWGSRIGSLDGSCTRWDNPTMSISKVDSKKRIVLPDGRPGDVFDVQQQAEGRFLLIRLEKPERAARMSKRACLEAMCKAPLQPTMPWEKLRTLTREP